MPTQSRFGQSDRWYYEHYRRGLIQRHICANGRLLQEVLLVEQDAAQPPPHAEFHANRRSSRETFAGSGAETDYSGYPVIVTDPNVRDAKFEPSADFVVGGGDNPLLDGGLAMATFALEDLLGVSAHSFGYAAKLLDYVMDSEVLNRDGDRSGFFLRRRQWWHDPKEISKDELCGLLIGLHFFHKAADQRGDDDQRLRAERLLSRLGDYLRDRDYAPAGAWLFQFPFTRIFKFRTGASYLSGKTFPDSWGFADELLEFLGGILTLDLDLNLDPKDLYRITTEAMDNVYGAANALDAWAELFGKDIPTNFYNVAMYFHTLLIIHDNPESDDVKDEMWDPFLGLFNYFCKPTVLGNPFTENQGHAAQNCYFAVVMEAFARERGKRNEVDGYTIPAREPLAAPASRWGHDLPLRDLPRRGDIPRAEPFGNKGWGTHFTWEHPDPEGHTLDWSWAKTLREIGPTDDHAELLVNSVSQGQFYFADLAKGYRVEAAGLDLLFPRILAAYCGLMDPPDIVEDEPFAVLPVAGPTTRGGFLGNRHSKEVHDYLNRKGDPRACQVEEITEDHKRWFRTLNDAHNAGYDNCGYCIGDSKR